jgi:hypothetical protein
MVETNATDVENLSTMEADEENSSMPPLSRISHGFEIAN